MNQDQSSDLTSVLLARCDKGRIVRKDRTFFQQTLTAKIPPKTDPITN
jgi:hypothetical protein